MKHFVLILLLCLSKLTFAYDLQEESMILQDRKRWDWLAFDYSDSPRIDLLFGDKQTRKSKVTWFVTERVATINNQQYILETEIMGVQISCKNRTFRIASVQKYEGAPSSKRIITNQNVNSPPSAIPPKTKAERMYQYVCLGKTVFDSM